MASIKTVLEVRLKKTKFLKEAKTLASDINKIAQMTLKKDKKKVGAILDRIDKLFRSWIEIAEKGK